MVHSSEASPSRGWSSLDRRCATWQQLRSTPLAWWLVRQFKRLFLSQIGGYRPVDAWWMMVGWRWARIILMKIWIGHHHNERGILSTNQLRWGDLSQAKGSIWIGGSLTGNNRVATNRGWTRLKISAFHSMHGSQGASQANDSIVFSTVLFLHHHEYNSSPMISLISIHIQLDTGFIPLISLQVSPNDECPMILWYIYIIIVFPRLRHFSWFLLVESY